MEKSITQSEKKHFTIIEFSGNYKRLCLFQKFVFMEIFFK